MVRSYSFAWILVSLLSLTLAVPLQADITPSGDVYPDLPDNLWWWTGGGDLWDDAYIGRTATGSVTVNSGSDLSSYYGSIGSYSGSTGVVTVDGSGSTWINSSSLYVGWFGQGTLNITDGGAVSSTYGTIGVYSGSTGVVTVDGSGSTWVCSGYYGLYVGKHDQGTLNITNGGAVSNTYGTIGEEFGATGVVTVDGNGSTWTCDDDLYVGHEGQGTLNITNSGAVNVTGNTWVARYDGSVGEIHFDVGTLTTGYLGAGATQLTGTGTINTHGLLSDVDLLFDSTHGLNQTLTLNNLPGQNITINLTYESTGALGAGYTGNGTLAIRDGVSVESSTGYIGYKAGATGEVTVDGNGSTWTCGSLSVGYSGQGTLNITNGGAVNVTYTRVTVNDGAVGEIHFDGGTLTTRSLFAGATQLTGTGTINTHGLVSDVDLLFDSTHGPSQTITLNSQPDRNITINLNQDSTGALGAGYAGNGTLAIRDGVSVESSSGHIGDKAGATGVVTVNGNGSTWTSSGSIFVGNYGQGTLNITNGGAVSNTSGHGCSYIGYKAEATGVVTVDGSGSTWNSDYLFVGDDGQGTLNITNGGAVSSNKYGSIGRWSGSTGVVTVDGSGSTWTNSGKLVIGSEGGHGTLNITNGGTVSNNEGSIGYYFGSTGVVTVDGNGSTWTNSGELNVGYHDSGHGTLNIINGGIVEVGGNLEIRGICTLNIGAAGQVRVGEALVLKQDSTLTAEAGAVIHMTGSAFQNESTNSTNLAGLGNLTLIFEGGSGVVDPFEAAGEDVGAVIGGFVTANFLLDTLQLGGVAAGKIQLVDYYDNQADGSGVGEAVYVNTLIMNAGATIDLNGLNLYYLNGGGSKQFFCGDATLDGYVDGGDLDILLADWGTGVPPANYRADLSGDFFVDGNDLDIILADWGKGVPPPVPEPVSAVLLLSGGVMAMFRRRRK